MTRHLVWIVVAAALLGGCRGEPSASDAPRPRIVSFSPALTAIIFEMGLGEHLVAVTSHCMLPAGEKRIVVGNRQNINAERIVSLRPDVILIQQTPGDFEMVRRADPEIKIEHFTIENLNGIASAVERIGRIVGREQLGQQMKLRFKAKLHSLRQSVEHLNRPRVLFLTGADPPSVPGGDSFLHEMIELAGGDDVAAGYKRWTQINAERILISRPDVVVCHSPPRQRRRVLAYLRELPGLPAAKTGRIYVVEDRRWTIPSMHLADLAERLTEIIHRPSLKGESQD